METALPKDSKIIDHGGRAALWRADRIKKFVTLNHHQAFSEKLLKIFLYPIEIVRSLFW